MLAASLPQQPASFQKKSDPFGTQAHLTTHKCEHSSSSSSGSSSSLSLSTSSSFGSLGNSASGVPAQPTSPGPAASFLSQSTSLLSTSTRRPGGFFIPNINAKLDQLFVEWLATSAAQQLIQSEICTAISTASVTRQTSNIVVDQPCSEPDSGASSVMQTKTEQSSLPTREPESMDATPSLAELRTASLSPSTLPKAHAASAAEATNDQLPSPVTPSVRQIPAFYFPYGRNPGPEELRAKKALVLAKAREVFSKRELTFAGVISLTSALGVSRFLAACLVKRLVEKGGATYTVFQKWSKELLDTYHDEESLTYMIVKFSHNDFIVESDLVPLVREVLATHPGLEFLGNMALFQDRYVDTVVQRIMYKADRRWDGKIRLPEWRRCGIVKVLRQLERQLDINEVRDFFSYKHFYVMYCKFWELDDDHDLLIDADELARYDGGALSRIATDRAVAGYGKKAAVPSKMTYKEFIWFILSEEDKSTPTAQEYWFRILDLDGDGVLSLYELERNFDGVSARLEQQAAHLGPMDMIRFADAICQMIDLVNPKDLTRITLRDLRASSMANVFLNYFANACKLLCYEQREMAPFFRPGEGGFSEWDRFAEQEYELMAMEESSSRSQDEDFGGPMEILDTREF